MSVKETSAICIIYTIAGVITFWVLHKMWLLRTSRVLGDYKDAGTVDI